MPLSPLSRIVDEVLTHVPKDHTVTVTASPSLGMGPTLEMAEALAASGVLVSPHIAARLVSGRDELAEIVSRLAAAGIGDLFVVAGDSPQAQGPFEGGRHLLEELTSLNVRFARIGVPGYPEGHPHLSPAETALELAEKLRLANYVVTQLCFEPGAMGKWVRAAAEARGTADLFLAVPGVVRLSRLLRIAGKLDVRSLGRFAFRHRSRMGSVLRGDFRGDGLAHSMLRTVGGPRSGAGVHLCTFNEVARTMDWYHRWQVDVGIRGGGRGCEAAPQGEHFQGRE